MLPMLPINRTWPGPQAGKQPGKEDTSLSELTDRVVKCHYAERTVSFAQTSEDVVRTTSKNGASAAHDPTPSG